MEDQAQHPHCAQLFALRQEHRDLDLATTQLTQDPGTDQLLLRRMKLRKLQVKDAINKLQSALIPDLNA